MLRLVSDPPKASSGAVNWIGIVTGAVGVDSKTPGSTRSPAPPKVPSPLRSSDVVQLSGVAGMLVEPLA